MNIYNTGPYALLIFVALPALAVCVGGWLFEHFTAKRRLRRAVFANLDSAYENGYFEPGEYLHRAGARSITFDLRAFAPDMFDHPANKLLPYVAEWLDQKGL